jgi:transcriptional regulator with XRE-family HTH domain
VRIPSLAKSLRAEIRRLAAREIERALRPLRRIQRQVKVLKSHSTKGRRGLARIERKLARLKTRKAPGGVPGRPGRKVAVGGPDILALRKRLGMTREQFAKLIGVSPGSIFGWESGRTTPRGASVARLGEAKKLGVRAAWARVEGPAGARSPRGKKRRGGRRKAKRSGQAGASARKRRARRSPSGRTRKAA